MPQTTVLVIEDEPLIRMTVADDLQDAGFKVIEAGNADEGLRLLKSDTSIRAIFTDIDMPGELDGLKLAWIVRDRWPPVEIIITSGHRRIGLTDMPERAVFFPKPYAHQPVIDTLTRLTRS
jgi:DNA-binding NtrC family response regulator